MKNDFWEYTFFEQHLAHYILPITFYMDSPPNTSLGINIFKLDDDPLESLQFKEVDHRQAEGELLDQFVFHNSVEVCLFEHW